MLMHRIKLVPVLKSLEVKFACVLESDIKINIFCALPIEGLTEYIIYFVPVVEFVYWNFPLLSAVHFLCPLHSTVCDP